MVYNEVLGLYLLRIARRLTIFSILNIFRVEVRATSCTVLPHVRFSALKLKSQHETICIIYLIKLLKILVDKALNTAESGYIYFAVVKFAWQASLALRLLRAHFCPFYFLTTTSSNINLL